MGDINGKDRKLFGEIVRSSILWHISQDKHKNEHFFYTRRRRRIGKKTSSAEARAKSNEAIGVEN